MLQEALLVIFNVGLGVLVTGASNEYGNVDNQRGELSECLLEARQKLF